MPASARPQTCSSTSEPNTPSGYARRFALGIMTTATAEIDLIAFLRETREEVNREIERLFGRGLEQHRVLYDLILEYPLRGGKALRPALAISTCRAVGGYKEAILPTAATLELYHNAFLIHDDVEDGSLMRRGEPTLHELYGTPIAVNVGDAMLVLSLAPLLDNVEVIGLGPALKILSLVANMTKQSVEGQAIELAWVRENAWDLLDAHYERMVIQKTGWYSFIAPMQAGAIVGGATSQQVDSIEPFAKELSIAFQIQDDLLNLRAEPEPYGKEIGGDLWEGKRTIMLLHAVRSASVEDAEEARRILSCSRPSSEPSLYEDLVESLYIVGHVTEEGRSALLSSESVAEEKTQEDVAWLHDLIARSGSIQYARQLARHHATRARDLLADMTWLPESSYRRVLEAIVDYVYERKK